MIKSGNILLLILLAVMALAQSCETERSPCLDASVNVIRAGAYRRADTGTAVIDSALRAPLFIAITDHTDSNIFVQTSGTNKFQFQLSDLSDTTRWVLMPDTAGSLQDTITFIYQRQLHFINNACGYNYFYNMVKVNTTHYAIDSIQLANAAVTSDASVEHIKIFF
jgi:hypothetical protein